MYIEDMVYRQPFIADTFSGNRQNTVKSLENNLCIADTYIADTAHNGLLLVH